MIRLKLFIQQEFKNVIKHKVFYSVRLYFQILGLLIIVQSLYSLTDSFLRLGEFQIIWKANWIYMTSFLLWGGYIITIITVGKNMANSGKPVNRPVKRS